MYAIVNINSSQYMASVGKLLRINGIFSFIGEELILTDVLFAKNNDGFFFGGGLSRKKVKVSVTVIDFGKSKKKIVFRMKRRKGYKRKYGSRQIYTLLQVNKIEIV